MPPKAFADVAVEAPAPERLALTGAALGTQMAPARRALTKRTVSVETCRLPMILLLCSMGVT
jgi:hypothetical protein